MEVTAGAFWKILPSTVTYEATIPLIYNSEWKEESLSRTGGEFSCGNLSRKDSRCVLLEGLDRLVDAFNKESDERAVKQTLNTFSRGLSETIRDITTDSDIFLNFQDSVGSTLNNTQERIKKLESYTRQITNNLRDNVEGDESIQVAFLRQQFEDIKLMIKMARIIKNQGVSMSCRQHQLPTSIIDPEILREDLRKLDKELNLEGYTLAIDVSQTAKYYQLPISDCTFMAQSLIINIRVPIVKKGHRWELFELITVPLFGKTIRVQ